MSKLKGPIWKKLSDSEKEKYVEIAKEMTIKNQESKRVDTDNDDSDVETVEI